MSEGAPGPTSVQLFADRPITSRSQDRLDRRKFAEALAGAIAGWNGQESLVIALYGPWGSGKSSLKHMVVESLGDSWPVVEFNPWQFANREQLPEAFFREVGVRIGTAVFRSEEDRRRIIGKWEKYRAYLQVGMSMLDAVRGPISTALIAVPLIQAAFSWLGTAWGVGFAVAAAVAGGVLKAFPKVTERIAEAIKAREEASVRPLPEVKADIGRELGKLPVPLLVVMDDVDRLTPREVQQLFQLVKANADFPNLVYLLLFQRDSVERSLEELWPGSGRDFLEKIVQVGFDVPLVDRQRLDSILFEKLDAVLAAKGVASGFESQRWRGMFVGGLQLYFTSMRDVYRFVSSLSFHVDLFHGEGVVDVNVVDLVALEVLRLFEPDVYTAIRGNRDVLTASVNRLATQEEDKAQIAEVIGVAPEQHRERVAGIIKQLFPVAGDTRRTAEAAARWRRDVRVCSEDVFPRYCRFSLTAEELAQADVKRLLRATVSTDGLRAELMALKGRNLLAEGLIELDAHKEEIATKNSGAVIRAIFDVGDELPHVSALLSEVIPEGYAASAIETLLRKIENEEERHRVLVEALSESGGMYLPVALIDDISQGIEDGDKLISRSGIEALKGVCVTKLREAGAARLAKLPKLGFILLRWAAWGNSEEATAACEEMLREPNTAVSLLRGLAQRAVVATSGEEAARALWSFDKQMIEGLVPVESIDRGLSAVGSDSLQGEDREIVDEFRQAERRWRRRAPSQEIAAPTDQQEEPSGRPERPVATEQELVPVIEMIGSEHEDVQALGLRRLADLVPLRRIEGREDVLRTVASAIEASKATTVQSGGLAVIASIFRMASGERKRNLAERFLLRVLELLDSSDPGLQQAAVEAAAASADDRALIRLIQFIRDEPVTAKNEGQVPVAAYSLRNVGERKDFVLAELRRQIVKEPDAGKRRRLVMSEDTVRTS